MIYAREHSLGGGPTRVAVLAGGPTAFPDVFHHSERFIDAFITLGCAAVIGCLWRTDDLADSLLLDAFYRSSIEADWTSPPASLQRPTRWAENGHMAGVLDTARRALRGRTRPPPARRSDPLLGPPPLGGLPLLRSLTSQLLVVHGRLPPDPSVDSARRNRRRHVPPTLVQRTPRGPASFPGPSSGHGHGFIVTPPSYGGEDASPDRRASLWTSKRSSDFAPGTPPGVS